MRYVYSTAETKRYKFPTHINELVMDRTQAEVSEVFVVVIEPGKAPPLHVHHDMEQVFYVLEGRGILAVGEGGGEQYAVAEGDLVRIPPSTPHTVRAGGGSPLRYLAVDCFTGGRRGDEPSWDEHVKVVCAQQDWDYSRIVEQVD